MQSSYQVLSFTHSGGQKNLKVRKPEVTFPEPGPWTGRQTDR